MIRLTPITDQISSEGIARNYRDHVWKLHGIPQRIISDRGSIFVSQFMDALHDLIGSKAALSTAYHPQTDGQTERVNQEVELFLRMFTNEEQSDWSDWLSIAEYVHNNRVHSATGYSPFYLNYGHHPRAITDPTTSTHVEAANTFVERMRQIRILASEALENAAKDMKKYYDAHREAPHKYSVGQYVWLDGSNISTSRPSKKLDDKRYGPFPIEKIISDNAYQLTLPESFNVHPVFNVVKLRPFHEDKTLHPLDQTRPPPAVTHTVERYTVDFLRDIKTAGRGFKYLVHWKGYPNEEDTWENASELRREIPKLVHEFHQQNPLKPRPINTITAVPFAQVEWTPIPTATTNLDVSLQQLTCARSAHLGEGVMSGST